MKQILYVDPWNSHHVIEIPDDKQMIEYYREYAEYKNRKTQNTVDFLCYMEIVEPEFKKVPLEVFYGS